MKNSVVILLTFLVAIGSFRVEAATVPAVQTANADSIDWRRFIGADQSASIGWSFSVGNKDVELDALGIYDDGMDGMVDAHAVGIWTNGGTLLAQTTVPSGTAGTLVGSYRYTALPTPITLTAGQTYVIGTYFGPVAGACSGSACGDIFLYNGPETYDPRITFLQSRQTRSIAGTGILAFPNLDAGVAEAFFGPNFLSTAVNNVPVFTVGGNRTHPFGTTAAQSFVDGATGISDGNPEVVQALTFNVTNDNNGLFSTQPSIAPNGTLSYTPNGSAGSATVSVTLTDDATANGAALTTALQTFTITVNPNPAGISVAPTSGLVTTEAGGTASFDVVLASQPTADVTVGLSSSDSSEGTVTPGITFTTANWNTPQTVTITGVDDAVDDGDIAYSIVTAQATSTDPLYAAIDPADLDLINTDNDTAGISVAPISGLVTTEAGGAASFGVVLASQPTADVTVGLSSSDSSEGTVAPGITFTTANWNTPQTVTITGVDDAVDDGDIAYSIVTAQATSVDPLYAAINPADVDVSNTDNDTAGISVAPTSGLVTTEAGGTASFDVVLASQPTADVTVGLSSSDSSEGTVSPASLTFTAANWNTAQLVTVTGVDDAVDDGDIAYSIVTAQATSGDGLYAAINPADVSVSNADDNSDAPLTAIIGLPSTSHYQEGQLPVQPVPLWSVLAFQDADGGFIKQAIVKIQDNQINSGDWLLVNALITEPSLFTLYDSVNGVLTINGIASQTVYQKVLQTVRYFTTKDISSPETRTLILTVTDVNNIVVSSQTELSLSPSIIIGTALPDPLNGTYAPDLIKGLADNDNLNGLGGNDRIEGGDGNDNLIGGGGDDTLIGSKGNDTLQGGPGNDHAYGGSGNDLFKGSTAGNDRYVGGSGNDTVDYRAATDGVTVSLKTSAWQAVSANSGNDALSGIENLGGSQHNDTLTGNALSNRLTGYGGNDRFVLVTTPGNIDTLSDYTPGQDRIVLSAGVFTAYAGQIGQIVGLSANLTYNAITGFLSYDADGAGPAAAVQLAIIGSPGRHPATLGNGFVRIIP